MKEMSISLPVRGFILKLRCDFPSHPTTSAAMLNSTSLFSACSQLFSTYRVEDYANCRKLRNLFVDQKHNQLLHVSDLLLHWTIDNHLTIRFYSLTENSVVIKTVIGGPV